MTCRLILATLALASLSTSPAFAYSSGPNSCSAQSHGGSAIKSGEGGHALAHDGGASPAPGARVTVTLSHPSTAFKGFIIKSDEGTLAVKDATKTQTVSACSGALGHKSAADKTSVEAYLTLPTAAGKTVTVSAEAVRGKMEVYRLDTTITTAGSTDPSPPSPPSPPPPPPVQLKLAAPAGCDPSSLGYACSAKLTSAGGGHDDHGHRRRRRNLLGASSSGAEIVLHWTPGGVDLAAAGVSSDVAVSSGHVAFAVQSTRHGAGHAVGVSFQEKENAMVPADAVIGWIGSGDANGHVGSYRLSGYSVVNVIGPSNPNLAIVNASVEASASTGTIVRFTANAADVGEDRVGASTCGAQARTSHHGPSCVKSIGYAVSSTAGLAYHDVSHGAAGVDLVTGKVVAVEIRGAERHRTHGLLMSVAFAAMAIGAASSLVAHSASSNLVPESHRAAWHAFHVATQAAATAVALAGLGFALDVEDGAPAALDWQGRGDADDTYRAHGAIGIVVALMPVVQALLGLTRERAGPERDDSGGEKATREIAGNRGRVVSEKSRKTPRRSAHRALGWAIVVGGLANCVLGAELLRRKLGDSPASYVASAAAFLCVAGVALFAKSALWFKSRGDRDKVRAYVEEASVR